MDSNETDLLIAAFARATESHVKEVKFLQGEIKALIGAIRSAPDLESLRVVAKESVQRMRKRSLEEERARLSEIGRNQGHSNSST